MFEFLTPPPPRQDANAAKNKTKSIKIVIKGTQMQADIC